MGVHVGVWVCECVGVCVHVWVCAWVYHLPCSRPRECSIPQDTWTTFSGGEKGFTGLLTGQMRKDGKVVSKGK